MAKFSPERLERIRKIRAFRRLLRKAPMLAFIEFPEWEKSWLPKPRPKKKYGAKKSYGRHEAVKIASGQYYLTGDYDKAYRATKLYKDRGKPYVIAFPATTKDGKKDTAYLFISASASHSSFLNLLNEVRFLGIYKAYERAKQFYKYTPGVFVWIDTWISNKPQLKLFQ